MSAMAPNFDIIIYRYKKLFLVFGMQRHFNQPLLDITRVVFDSQTSGREGGSGPWGERIFNCIIILNKVAE